MQDLLRRLAAVAPASVPVLSVYRDMRPQNFGKRPTVREGLVMLKDQFRAIEKTLLPRGPALDAFRADAEQIEQFLREDTSVSAQGVAIFAAADQGIFETVTVGAPFENEVTFAPTFDLFQLARLAEDYETAVVAVANTNTLRLFVMRLGHLAEADGLDEDPYWFGGRRKFGENKLRYQRHLNMLLRDFAQEGARAIEALVAEEGATRVVLAGEDVAMPLLRRELAPHILSLVVTEPLRIDYRASRNEIVALTEPVLAQAEAAQEESLGDELIAATRSGGLGVIGLASTQRALAHGQGDVLIIEGQAVIPAEERSELVRQAALTSAAVEVLADHEGLRALGGVGALLRFRHDYDGLGGASSHA